jgi:hypothetical protein
VFENRVLKKIFGLKRDEVMVDKMGGHGEWIGMDWIDLAEDRDKLRALVNIVMNL